MELLRIKTDLAFKYVFGRDEKDCKEALIKLLNTILSMNIKDITYMNPINIKHAKDLKETVYDIKITADDGNSQIDIEIQLRNHESFKERLIYYIAELLTRGSMTPNGDYSEMRRCIVVSILDFDLFATEDFHNTFCFKEKDKDIILSDIATIVTLEMTKLRDKSVKDMTETEKWLNYLRYAGVDGHEQLVEEIVKESEAISMANKLLKNISADDLVKEEILARERYQRIKNTEMNSAMRKGIEIGEANAVRKMLSKGKSVEEISQLIDLPVEKINAMLEAH